MRINPLLLTLVCLALSVSVVQAQDINRFMAHGSEEQSGLFIDPELKRQINTRGATDVLVFLKGQADLSPAYDMSWEDRGHFVYNTLRQFARRSQAGLRADLDASGVDYQAFWIDNVIAVRGVTFSTLATLSQRDDIRSIILPPVVTIPQPREGADIASRAVEWSVNIIDAPSVWALGYFGQGVVLATIDSGVEFDHPALVGAYRGSVTGSNDFSFFDPNGQCPAGQVCGIGSHGTHVTGSMIGDDGGSNQIGVAPGATWIAAVGCAEVTCFSNALLSSAEWMLAPCAFGDVPGDPSCDPNQRPHVINNSWGGPGGQTWFQGSVDAWRAAGMIPVVSAGNSGPSAETIGSPGDYCNVIGVGGTNISDGMYPSSSRGPGNFPECLNKPDVSAPGQGVRSSVAGGGYAAFSGTSMAAPHVSGCIGLMLSADPSLDYDSVYDILIDTAVDLGAPGFDFDYGHGRIDCLAAVTEVLVRAGPRGTIAGTVTEIGSGLPISGAIVEVTDGTDSWQTSTAENGNYSLLVAEGSDYDVVFTAFGFQSETLTGIDVVEDETTTVNAQLSASADYVVSGTVADSIAGWPLHAEIEITGYPGSPIYTNPADGSYSVTLPEGMAFEFAVTALSGGYDPIFRSVGPLGADASEDFDLEADLVSCSAPGYSAAPLYFENFEADDGGFVSSGTNNSWEWGAPTSAPSACGEGVRCWGTNLGGNYPNFHDAEVVSPIIDLSAASAPLTLRWQQFNHIETFTFDQGFAEYRVDGGPWQIIWQNPGLTVAENWRELTADISDAAGGELELRWRLESDSTVNFAGLYFDAIEITSGLACAPIVGELVVGRVTDANTGQGLVGATVEVDVVGTSTITGVSPDPALGEGAYTLHVPDGVQQLIAKEAGYEDAAFETTFVDGQARRVDFALNSGRVSATPESLTKTITFGETDTGFLILVNDGTAPAEVSLTAVDLIREDFEGTFPPADWTVENLGGSCDWVRNDEVNRPNFAGGDGFSAAADSDACGLGTTMDTALVSRAFTAGPETSLDFVLSYFHLGTSRLDVDVWDGADWLNTASYTSSVDAEGPGAPQSIDLSAYAGSDIQVRFRYVSGWHWWAQVDQIQINGAVDWLGFTPDMGVFSEGDVVPLFDTLNVTVNYDASAPSVTAPGTYEAAILIDTNTPYGSLMVPVEMIVEPAANQARIAGTVSSLGYCDVNPAPAAGATVDINDGAHVLTTDANGEYELWLDISEAPLVMNVSAPGHVAELITGVPLVSQGTTVREFNLRAELPCASADPASLSIELLPGGTGQLSLSLVNAGAGALASWQEFVFTGNVTLINQPDNDDDGIVSARFEGLSPATGAYSAQNFAVNGQSIETITAAGFTGPGNPDIDTFASEIAFFIYPDAGGVPAGHPEDGGGSEAFSFVGNPSDAAFTIVDDDLTLDVASVNGGNLLQLPNGVYWLVAYATVPGTEGSPRWNWYAATTNTGTDAQIITPGAAFDGGFPFWSSIAANVDPVYAGLALTIEGQVDCGASWFSLSPDQSEDAIAAGESDSIMFDVDAEGLAAGVHVAQVCIETSDSQAGLIVVPVTLEVLLGPNDAILEGTVSSLGYCSDNPFPAAGATIQVDGDQGGQFSATADGNGFYSLIIDADESPVTVTALAPDHTSATEVDVTLIAQETVTVDFDLVLEAACATATPAELSILMAADDVDGQALTLVNSGALAYSWSIEFDEAAAGIFGAVDVVEDGGFEGGSPNAAWDESSAAFGSPLCTVDLCGSGGGSGPNNGIWWTWFGGTSSAETASVSQDVTIPVGSAAELGFFLEIPASDQPGFMEVRLGGDVLFTVTEADSATYATYQQVILDVGAYADGGTYKLEFYSETQEAQPGSVTNFFVDDVSLVVQPGPLLCADPQGVSWLSVDQSSGSVDAQSSEDVIVIYDSTGLAVGSYQATLCLETSDPENALIIIPVSLQVAVDEVFSDRFEQAEMPAAERGGDVYRKLPD